MRGDARHDARSWRHFSSRPCAAPAALAQAPAWETYGPSLFQVNAVAVGPDELTVYAGGADYAASQAALFKSADGGRRWTRSCRRTPGEFYSDILVDPASPSTIYAGALFNGTTRIYRTGDGGATWSLGQTIPSYCVPSFAAGTSAGAALVACGTHLYRTSDAGLTWLEAPAPFTEATRLTTGPAGAFFAYGPTHIFKSVNGGNAWTAVGNPLPLRRHECAARRSDQRVDLRGRCRRARGRRPDLRRRVPQHERGKHLDREQPLGRVRHGPRHRLGRAGARLRVRRVPRRHLPEGRGVCERRRGRRLVEPRFSRPSAPSRLALSDSGHILYAATSVGVYTLAGAGGPTTCTPDDQTLCLDEARFRVTATWTKPDASSGQGHAVALTGDTGYFWFFDSSNVEVIVKVLEACGVNGYRWVFASGLTNVQVNLTVTDVVTGTRTPTRTPRDGVPGRSRTRRRFRVREPRDGSGGEDGI